MRSFLAVVAAVMGWMAFSGSSFVNPMVTVGVAYSTDPESVIPEGRMVSAFKAYVDWHRESGRGFRYRLLTEGYDHDPMSAIERLKDRGAKVVVGFPFSSQALKARELAERLRIPVLSTVASSPHLSGIDDWFFRVKEEFTQETVIIASIAKSLGVRSLAGIWSGTNYPYSVGSIKEVLSNTDIRFTGLFRFPEDCDFLQAYPIDPPEAVLIYADPSVSFWTVQFVRSLWPDSRIFMSRWSLFENHRYLTSVKNASFYYTEAYDPLGEVQGDFADYWRSITSQDFSVSVRYSYGAMEFLSQVFSVNPSLSGRALRDAMSVPREIPSLGWTIRTDRFGDSLPESKGYLFEDGEFREVEL
nr:ABC transporter substrate-binding protein [uncultured Dethiosulfovibrio sp.]